MNLGDWSVKNVKTFMGMDCPGYNCSLYYGTKRVATVVNDGSGGPTMIDWNGGYKNPHRTLLEEHIKTLPPIQFHGKDLSVNEDMFIEDLVEDFELKKKCKTKTLFKKDGELFSVRSKFTTDVVEWINKNHPGSEILNFRFGNPS